MLSNCADGLFDRFVQSKIPVIRIGPASVILLAAASTTWAQHYTVIELDSLPNRADAVEAFDLNDRADVVGASSYKEFNLHINGFIYYPRAFGWSNDSTFDLGTLGGEDSIAFGVNNAGQVVGESTLRPNRAGLGALLYDDGQMQSLPEVDDAFTTHAIAINNQSQIVGKAKVGAGRINAILWENDRAINLGVLNGGRDSEATGINDNGTIVGLSDVNGHPVAFMYREDEMTALGGLERAFGINENDVVVGQSANHAALWENGRGQILSSFSIYPTRALDINDRGEIVGTEAIIDANGLTDEAIYWDVDRRPALLKSRISPNLEYRLLSGNAINNRGQIAVVAENSDGEKRALLLTAATLELNGPQPGQAGVMNEFVFDGLDPDTRIVVAYGFNRDATPIPGCRGIGLSIKHARLFGAARADGNGRVEIRRFVPSVAAGRTVVFQGFAPGTCAISNVVMHTF